MDTGGPESLHPAIAALEASGADRLNPVRFRYIKTMATRSLELDGMAADLVATKALTALQEFQRKLSAERADAEALVASLASADPTLADEAQSLLDTWDFRAVHRLAECHQQRPAAGDLAGLLQRLDAAAATCEPAPAASELRSARYFRDTMRREDAQNRVARAVLETPKDSGPLNPQKLAMSSLVAMRDLSPAYVARFVAYLDALFWLENMKKSHKH